MFENFLREQQIRKALKAIARQRVTLILQPGNIEVIELSPPDEEWFQLGVRTARIRGWVEVLHENLPTGTLKMKGNNPQLPNNMVPETHYKLTEAGWAVLNSSHAWVLATFIVTSVALVVSAASLFFSLPKQ